MDKMSETKTPKPGEWWLRNSGGRIFYISGFNPEGWVVHWNEDVGFFSSKMRFFCKEFHHEPRCTGFGWVEPPDVCPGESPDDWVTQDRFAVRCGSDEVRWSDWEPDKWVVPLGFWPLELIHGFVDPNNGSTMLIRCRRRDLSVESPAEDPNDMPLNPVPGKVVATGTVTFTPVESPDNMAAIIAEHTQQVRELTQRIGELVQQVNQRDAMIEQIRTALHQGYFV